MFSPWVDGQILCFSCLVVYSFIFFGWSGACLSLGLPAIPAPPSQGIHSSRRTAADIPEWNQFGPSLYSLTGDYWKWMVKEPTDQRQTGERRGTCSQCKAQSLSPLTPALQKPSITPKHARSHPCFSLTSANRTNDAAARNIFDSLIPIYLQHKGKSIPMSQG